jgi:hypothetical protein
MVTPAAHLDSEQLEQQGFAVVSTVLPPETVDTRTRPVNHAPRVKSLRELGRFTGHYSQNWTVQNSLDVKSAGHSWFWPGNYRLPG